MSKIEIPRDLIVEALENAAFDEDNIRKGTYGGRWNVDADAAVVLPRDIACVVRFAFELGRLHSIDGDDAGMYDRLTGMMDTTAADSMGREDNIYYWGNVTFTD